jgi:hypothetical protein
LVLCPEEYGFPGAGFNQKRELRIARDGNNGDSVYVIKLPPRHGRFRDAP